MVLHHTGSEGELVYCSTPCLSVTIKGAEASPPLVKCDQKEASLKIVCDDDFEVTLSGDAEMAFSQYLGKAYNAKFRSLPVFFEQKRYELIVEPAEGHRVEFWHENYHIRNKVSHVGRAGKLLSGVINFGNDIGYSDLEFRVDGHQYLRITIEVFPSKISYKDDYLAIVSDVTKEVYNLVFDFLRKTYESFDVTSSQQSSPVEFYAIIQKIYDEYIAAADMVLRSPHHLLQQETEVLPQHKIRRCDGKTLRWLEKHPSQMIRGTDGIRVEKALAVRKYVTYDTRENRLTKYMLEKTAQRLERFRKQYELISQDINPVVLERICSMIAGIQRRCNTGFMKEVSSEPSGAGMSLVFGMAPGYRQLYRCYLLLQHGLAVTGSVFNVSVKDLAVLYEYWCFIKLNSLMKDKYELVSQDIIRTNGTGLSVSLIKGQRSRVKYRDLKTGEVITLSYNPMAVNVPTVTQRPDNVLRLEKKGAETDYEYVFDAKYRINPSIEGTDYHQTISKTPGPEVDDINTMHRYRDAIVYHYGNSPFERTMFGAYVLFPYANEEEYRHHRFFESIDKVNIGGLPFLPSATSMVTDMLEDLIDDSPESAFERATLPKGIESKLEKVNWNCRDVLIGTIRQPEQLDIFLSHQFYYVPSRILPFDKLPIHEVAIYQSKDLYGKDAGIEYYGEVVSLEKMPRRMIIEIPRDSDELYYRLNIRDWKRLDRKIEVKEYGVRSIAFTNDFLLKHSTLVPELFLKTEEEYRFLTELKRFVMDASVINDAEEIKGFVFGDNKVFFQNGEINLVRHGRVIAMCTIANFMKRSNVEFRDMMAKMKQN